MRRSVPAQYHVVCTFITGSEGPTKCGITFAPLPLRNGKYLGLSMQLFIDKADGNVVHLFRGADLQSLGGELLVTPKALLAISNLAITAYPLGEGQPTSKPETGAAAATAESGSMN